MTEAVQAMEDSHCSNWCADTSCIATLCDLKVTPTNMQYSLIQELMLYNFKLSHNAMEATKNICSMKAQLITEELPKDLRNFTQVSRTLMIRQG